MPDNTNSGNTSLSVAEGFTVVAFGAAAIIVGALFVPTAVALLLLGATGVLSVSWMTAAGVFATEAILGGLFGMALLYSKKPKN